MASVTRPSRLLSAWSTCSWLRDGAGAGGTGGSVLVAGAGPATAPPAAAQADVRAVRVTTAAAVPADLSLRRRGAAELGESDTGTVLTGAARAPARGTPWVGPAGRGRHGAPVVAGDRSAGCPRASSAIAGGRT